MPRGGGGAGRTTTRRGGGRATGGTIGHNCEVGGRRGGQGIPVLDVLSRPPVDEGPPLLMGGMLTLSFANLMLCQRRALEVAISNHHCNKGERTSSYGGGDAGCGADLVFGGCAAAVALLIAIIDGYTTLPPLKIVPRIVPPIVQKPPRKYLFLRRFLHYWRYYSRYYYSFQFD
jgi:hypothetical protein